MQIGLGLWLGTRQVGGFDPAAVLFGAGEQGGWYDTSDLSTMFQDTAGTVPVTATGQTVARINDKSGRGNHLTQATAASRPQYQIDANGLPFLLFDGPDDWFVSPTITPGIDKAQVFVGVRKLNDTASGIFVETSASASSNAGAFTMRAPRTADNYSFGSGGTLYREAVSSGYVPPITNVVTGLSDIAADTATIRVNGVQIAQNVTDQGTGNFLAYPLYVGRRGGTSLAFNGRMYQMIVRFGANLDASTIAATEAFVNSKTGAYGFASAPANYDAIFFGDSRTENGFAPNVNTGGYAANLNNVGVAAQLGPMSGHRLRVGKFANFGIGGGTSIQAAFDPRQAASGSVTTGQWWRGGQTDSPTNSGSSNKSISDAIAHPAGIVVMLTNTNDGPTNWPVNSRTAMTTIINALTAAGKVVVLLNETPRGVNSAGALQSDLSAANMALFKDLSDWLSKWDYASGDVLANPRVIVIDSWNEFYDPATGANYYNKVGYLHDGLHFTPFASKRLAQMIDNKLSSVWRQYAALPRRRTLPTANGFAAIANTTPYLNSNPIFTPGTNGTVSGTWGSAPTAATVCQGWTIAGSGTISGINLVAEKGVDTDPDGFPVQKLTVTGGSLADLGTATVILQQSFTNIAALTSAGMLSLTSKLRAMARVKIDAGSNLLSSVNVSLTVFADTTAKNLTARTMRTSSFLPLNRIVDMADGEWYDYVTELLDIAEPNMSPIPSNPTSITSMVFTVNMQFDNRTGATATPSAVVRIARAGPYVTAD